jgi:hypothetical protein
MMKWMLKTTSTMTTMMMMLKTMVTTATTAMQLLLDDGANKVRCIILAPFSFFSRVDICIDFHFSIGALCCTLCCAEARRRSAKRADSDDDHDHGDDDSDGDSDEIDPRRNRAFEKRRAFDYEGRRGNLVNYAEVDSDDDMSDSDRAVYEASKLKAEQYVSCVWFFLRF